MNKRQRRQHAEEVLNGLGALRREWGETQPDSVINTPMTMARRERFKILEAEAAVIRLVQAESRLGHQVLLALFSFAGGSVMTLLVKPFLPG